MGEFCIPNTPCNTPDPLTVTTRLVPVPVPRESAGWLEGLMVGWRCFDAVMRCVGGLLRLAPDGLAAKPVPYGSMPLAIRAPALAVMERSGVWGGVVWWICLCLMLLQHVWCFCLRWKWKRALTLIVDGNNQVSNAFHGIVARHAKANQRNPNETQPLLTCSRLRSVVWQDANSRGHGRCIWGRCYRLVDEIVRLVRRRNAARSQRQVGGVGHCATGHSWPSAR